MPLKINIFVLMMILLFAGLVSGCKKKSNKGNSVEQLRPMQEPEEFKIFPRSDWTDEGPDETHIVPMATIYRVTIHHTAMPDDELPDLGGDSKVRLQKILMWHKHNNGWADVGYHYIIDPEGKVWEGRNIKYQGAHAGNEVFNVGNIGVVLVGNFENHEFPETQQKALFEFIHFLKKKYKIESKNIFAHDHFKDTKCPGKNVLPFIEQLRNEE